MKRSETGSSSFGLFVSLMIRVLKTIKIGIIFSTNNLATFQLNKENLYVVVLDFCSMIIMTWYYYIVKNDEVGQFL